LILRLRWYKQKRILLNAIHDFKPDIILSDYSLPQFTGFEALEIAKKLIPDIPFIIITGSLSEEMAADSIKKRRLGLCSQRKPGKINSCN